MGCADGLASLRCRFLLGLNTSGRSAVLRVVEDDVCGVLSFTGCFLVVLVRRERLGGWNAALGTLGWMVGLLELWMRW